MRDDVRKLLGGYATGSLTEAERKLLIETALDDQELFDELAREDVLRELLETPGARQRLLAVLADPPRKTAPAWWARPWPWIASATGIAIVTLAIVLLRPSPKPVQVADAIRPVLPAAQDVPVVKEVAPVRKTAKPVAEPKAKKIVPEETADKKAEAAPPAAPDVARELNQVTASKDSQTGAAAIGGLGGVPPAPAALRMKAAAAKAPRFAFDYALNASGVLTITPAAAGYLTIETDSGGAPQRMRLQPGTPAVVQLPAVASEVTIRFSAIADPPAEPAPLRDSLTGTVEASDTPPNSSAAIRLRIPPRN